MKYVFISDVHGCFDKMMKALQDANFNQDTDTLVSLGDLFDRGSKSKEVLEYVLQTPHHIFVCGNHDYRLYELVMLHKYAQSYDVRNGVPETLISFLKATPNTSMYVNLQRLKYNDEFAGIRQMLQQYFDECYFAIEFSDLIGTHAWLPYYAIGYAGTDLGVDTTQYCVYNDWQDQSLSDWEECIWADSKRLLKNDALPNKDMIVGHHCAWDIATLCGYKRFNPKKMTRPDLQINCDIFAYEKNHKVYFIDGCAIYEFGGKVNVFVKVTDEEPRKIHKITDR